jgi:sarcosine oxidase subunit gamma
VRDALAKVCTIDLHPSQFHAGRIALTSLGHLPAILWQIDESPAYEIVVPRSFARSFLDALIGASAEFGCEAGSATQLQNAQQAAIVA